jgi:hypothetical protein
VAQCTATSKRSKQRCRAPSMRGKTVCVTHGGKSPSGIAAGGFRTGRYSKHLPSRLLATYETAQRDPDLLALREEVALVDARLTDLLARVETGESGFVWRELRDTYREYRKALALTDIPEMKARLEEIGTLITRGVSDEAAWIDIRATLEQRRKLVESERKRLVEMQQMLSAEQAAVMVRALVASVREHVDDPRILRAISDDLARLAVA